MGAHGPYPRLRSAPFTDYDWLQAGHFADKSEETSAITFQTLNVA